MKYAIYFTWSDKTEDSFNVQNRKERDFNLDLLVKNKDIVSIEYSRIYSNGEYGAIYKVR